MTQTPEQLLARETICRYQGCDPQTPAQFVSGFDGNDGTVHGYFGPTCSRCGAIEFELKPEGKAATA